MKRILLIESAAIFKATLEPFEGVEILCISIQDIQNIADYNDLLMIFSLSCRYDLKLKEEIELIKRGADKSQNISFIVLTREYCNVLNEINAIERVQIIVGAIGPERLISVVTEMLKGEEKTYPIIMGNTLGINDVPC
ncbi:MAG: hypothetical protein JSV33_02235 [bacterium]|nr:MAG: hypothetical protein JSV33_02235 [bacterium]